MKKVAIFGASGYLGNSLIRAVVQSGIPVVAFVRRKEAFTYSLRTVFKF
ncbi:NmrA family NAD(P)-binding protein [Alteromonas naphthalenivorans]|uniref:NmrA-like domain-containing protein n=1 Tax=Alteromonas naphthalenivorans TaxID=715451 RepID=F5Z810_ALTNA|nr:NmrA family NAD(P)-binding protein [Alteromonas naphthalenivorans]AEF03203.1 hypothetical protein ambt_08375 [Alteromonas naphthalenivorans]